VSLTYRSICFDIYGVLHTTIENWYVLMYNMFVLLFFITFPTIYERSDESAFSYFESVFSAQRVLADLHPSTFGDFDQTDESPK
jgi:hypothetical protein